MEHLYLQNNILIYKTRLFIPVLSFFNYFLFVCVYWSQHNFQQLQLIWHFLRCWSTSCIDVFRESHLSLEPLKPGIARIKPGCCVASASWKGYGTKSFEAYVALPDGRIKYLSGLVGQVQGTHGVIYTLAGTSLVMLQAASIGSISCCFPGDVEAGDQVLMVDLGRGSASRSSKLNQLGGHKFHGKDQQSIWTVTISCRYIFVALSFMPSCHKVILCTNMNH